MQQRQIQRERERERKQTHILADDKLKFIQKTHKSRPAYEVRTTLYGR